MVTNENHSQDKLFTLASQTKATIKARTAVCSRKLVSLGQLRGRLQGGDEKSFQEPETEENISGFQQNRSHAAR